MSGAGEIELFPYPGTADPAGPAWELWDSTDIGENGDRSGAEQPSASPSAEPAQAIPWEERLEEEARRGFEAGREQGFQAGLAAEREARGADTGSSEKLRSELASRLAEDFQRERSSYFEAVEQEVVKLALAVAARILRREAQMDPLLLTGAVRVALGQLSASTQVRLRVPAADLELWKDTMAHLPNLAVRPAVVAGDGMQPGDCRMETELGSVDLGVRTQLGEIERGFFDRAERSTFRAPGPDEVVAGKSSI
jgi:flagellar assembly protein FliH